jgi:glycosyltransferase involved in cell wall biosynthesis
MIRCFSQMNCHVTHIYKALNRSSRFADLLKDTFTASVRASDEGTTRLVRVDPPFNYFAGLEPAVSSWSAERSFRQRLRGRLLRLLYPLRVFRDVFFVPTVTLVVLLRERGRYDVCIGFGPWGALAGWALRAMGRVRVLVYEDQDYEPGLVPDRLRQAYTRRVERFATQRADLLVSVGEYLAELRRNEAKREVHVIPNGVAWERFRDARKVERQGDTLLYVGNVVSWSGLEIAIRAMPAILESFPGARLKVVGDGPASYRESLVALVSTLNLETHVEFLGSIPHVELAFCMAGAAIGLAISEPVPYRRYAYPLKVIEYMAAGLPVIGTVGTETERIIERCQCGIASAYGVESFVPAAIRLLGDTEFHGRARASGLRHSKEMTWESLFAGELAMIRRRLDASSGATANRAPGVSAQ